MISSAHFARRSWNEASEYIFDKRYVASSVHLIHGEMSSYKEWACRLTAPCPSIGVR